MNKDRQILISCSIGNQTAFRKLFEEYRKKIYATSYKITGSEYASEEIVQEVFIDLWEGRLNLRNVDKPSGYIFRIVYRKIYHYLRRLNRDRRLQQGLLKAGKDKYNNTEEYINFKDVQGLIDQAVEKLPPRRKLIYKLSREEELNNLEITQKLDGSISPLTVKKHLILALNDLRASLIRQNGF